MVEKNYVLPIGEGTYYQYFPSNPPVARFVPSLGWKENTYFKSHPNAAWMQIVNSHRMGFDVRESRKRDCGNGYFTKEAAYVSNLSHPYHTTSPSKIQKVSYSGPFLPTTSNHLKAEVLKLVPWPSLESIDVDLNGLGSTAISQTIPTRTNASLAVTLAELRKEGLPKLMGLQLRNGLDSPLKSAAGEYLNYQFGWVPLISDLVSILTAVKDTTKILKQYRRNSGKSIRRRYQFDQKKEAFSVTLGGIPGYPNSSNEYTGASTGNLTISGVYTVDAWFSGAYRYLIPINDSLWDQILEWEREANILLGTRITPEVIWNVTSWTWLLDWFANIGNVVTNISYLGVDGLALHYGYIMRHTNVKATAHSTLQVRDSSRPLQCDFELSQKVRRRATPYGFGINPDSFTLKQWSILAALGITKVPGRL